MKNVIPAIFVITVMSLSAPEHLHAAHPCDENIDLRTPDSDFTINGDKTITHKTTGLMWSRSNVNAANSSSDYEYNWLQALEIAEASTLAGYTDWRLPNIKELASIVETACHIPSININVFPGTSTTSAYWTSTPVASFPSYAWAISFNKGFDKKYPKEEDFDVSFVRIVRGGN